MTYYEYFMPHNGMDWVMAIFLVVFFFTIGWRMALVFIAVMYLCVVESRDWIWREITCRVRKEIVNSMESRKAIRKALLTMPRMRSLKGEKK
jgi:ABC-type bacteriocin/lantibiotic exporter with double-glycine peptidase domain